jgi:hypothetical protein
MDEGVFIVVLFCDVFRRRSYAKAVLINPRVLEEAKGALRCITVHSLLYIWREHVMARGLVKARYAVETYGLPAYECLRSVWHD